jgi:hypothetical protein
MRWHFSAIRGDLRISGKGRCKFKDSRANPGFASDLSEIILRYPIAAWFHGHPHCSLDHYVGATRIVSNPRGYPEHGQMENEDFDPELVIEI